MFTEPSQAVAYLHDKGWVNDFLLACSHNNRSFSYMPEVFEPKDMGGGHYKIRCLEVAKRDPDGGIMDISGVGTGNDSLFRKAAEEHGFIKGWLAAFDGVYEAVFGDRVSDSQFDGHEPDIDIFLKFAVARLKLFTEGRLVDFIHEGQEWLGNNGG